LAGHSYNAYTREASQSGGKKLSSMGVQVIPADCLMPAGAGPTVWHFANQILNATALAKRHPNLFLLSVSNFSCTIDAYTRCSPPSWNPASEFQSRLRAPTIDELIRDAICEVLNVASSAIAAEGWAMLMKMVTNRSEIGDAVETIVARPTYRIDFNVSVDDYDGGRLRQLWRVPGPSDLAMTQATYQPY
jgi:hypothetical protein